MSNTTHAGVRVAYPSPRYLSNLTEFFDALQAYALSLRNRVKDEVIGNR